MTRSLFASPAALASLALFTAAPARAQSFDITGASQRRAPDERAPPSQPSVLRFGRQGEIVLSTASTTAYVASSTDGSNDASSFSAGISPGVDYFFVRHVSIGLDLEAYYQHTRSYVGDATHTHTTLAAGPRLGVDLPIGEGASFYPRLTVGVESVHAESVSSAAGLPAGVPFGQTAAGAWINVFAPVLWHPHPHFFVGAGPRFFHGFAKQASQTGAGGERSVLGGELVVGGHWGGEAEEPPEAPSHDAQPPARRFGERAQVVLTGEMDASLELLTYAGSDVELLTATFAPGADVFVVDHFSVGLALGFGYASAPTIAADGTNVDYAATSFGAAPRVGVDLPLAPWLSFYPRAEVGYGVVVETESGSGSAEYRRTYTRVWTSVSTPLLLHAASHFFVGLGPRVTYEFAGATLTGPDAHRTTIGGSLLLGGWL